MINGLEKYITSSLGSLGDSQRRTTIAPHKTMTAGAKMVITLFSSDKDKW